MSLYIHMPANTWNENSEAMIMKINNFWIQFNAFFGYINKIKMPKSTFV